MAGSSALVQELREQWLANDGIGIELSLRRLLGVGDGQLASGMRSLAVQLGYDVKEGPKQKRRREAVELVAQREGEAAAPPAVMQVRLAGFDLSAEIGKLILEALSPREAHGRMPCLAKAFRKLVLNRAMWRELIFNDTEGVDGLRCPANSASFVRIVSLPRFADIHTIRLDGYTGARLKPNLEACKALGKLTHLRRVAFPHMGVFDAAWPRLADGLKMVEEAWFDKFNLCLPAIAKYMTSIVRLRIDLIVMGTIDAHLLKRIAVLSCLRHLFLRGSGSMAKGGKSWSFAGGFLTNEVLKILLAKAPALEALDISFNFMLTGDAAAALGLHSSLRTLRWQHPGNSINTKELLMGLRGAPALMRLDLSSLSPCPKDGTGQPKDLAGLQNALSKVEVISHLRASYAELAELVPSAWPAQECALGFGDLHMFRD